MAYRGRVLVELSTQLEGKADKEVDKMSNDDILVVQVKKTTVTRLRPRLARCGITVLLLYGLVTQSFDLTPVMQIFTPTQTATLLLSAPTEKEAFCMCVLHRSTSAGGSTACVQCSTQPA